MARPTKHYQEVLRSYPRSRKINLISLGAEALYMRLLVLADCAGRFPSDPAVVLSLALAERLARGQVVAADVAGWIDEMERVGLLVRYEVANEPLLELQNYFRTANNRVVATYPAPPVPTTGTERPHYGDGVSPHLHGRGDSPRRDGTERDERAREAPSESDAGPSDPPRWSPFVDAMTRRLISRAPGGGGLDGKKQWPIGDRVSKAVELVHRLYPDRHEDAESALGRMFEAKLADHDPLSKKAITHLHCWLMGESGSDLLPTLSQGLQREAGA